MDNKTIGKTVVGGTALGTLIWWLLRKKKVLAEPEPGVDGRILDYSLDPQAGKVGDTVSASVYWENLGVVEKSFDIQILYGGYGIWTSGKSTEVVLPGESATTVWNLVIPDLPVGIYSATVRLMRWGYVYDEVVFPETLQVVGVIDEPANIEGLLISGG
jgi:hypothetical protein